MSTDLEGQLATLGRHVNDIVGHVGVSEILARSERSRGAEAGLQQDDWVAVVETADRRPRWPLAVAAAIVVLLAGSVIVVRSRDGDAPLPVDEPAPIPAFVPTGNMQTDCSGCPAFLLDDGRVLVAGGEDRQGASVVQTYDPATGTFSIIGELDGDVDRGALLDDGRIVLAGGNGELALFDPATGSAQTLRTENDPHQVPTGLDYTVQIPVALDDGRVLVFSQTGASQVDVATGELRPAGTMAAPLNDTMAVVPLLDGNVLVIGPPLIGGDPVFQIYDPDRGVFVPTGTPTSTMVDVGAIRLLDGRVLVIASGVAHHAEIYDPVTGTFASAGPLPNPTGTMASPLALLPDGRVLVLETTNDTTAVAATHIFDPATGTFAAGPPTTRPRLRATAVALEDGRVLVLGSYRGNARDIPGDGPSSAEIFSLDPVDPASE